MSMVCPVSVEIVKTAVSSIPRRFLQGGSIDQQLMMAVSHCHHCIGGGGEETAVSFTNAKVTD